MQLLVDYRFGREQWKFCETIFCFCDSYVISFSLCVCVCVSLSLSLSIYLSPSPASHCNDRTHTSNFFPGVAKLRFQRITGLSLPLVINVMPKKTNITVVVGKPIPVKKVEKPTKEQVSSLLNTYIEALKALHEMHRARLSPGKPPLKVVYLFTSLLLFVIYNFRKHSTDCVPWEIHGVDGI